MADNREKDLLDVFVLLADSLRTGHDIIDTMDILVQSSTTFTSAVEAGLMLADAGGTLHVVASTSERVAEVEEAQLGLHEGPCLVSFRTALPVEVPDIAASRSRWPDFAAVAESRGFLAAHAVPLRHRTTTLGGINLFGDRLGALSDRDATLVEAMAQMATISVIQHQIAAKQATVNDQLQNALESRMLIEQAKGVLSQLHTVQVDDAFRMMRTYARSTGTKLRDVAENVVRRRLEL